MVLAVENSFEPPNTPDEVAALIEHFDSPSVFCEDEMDVIDTTVVPCGDGFLRFTKREKSGRILMEKASSLRGPWEEVESDFLRELRNVEGPICYSLDDGRTVLLLDGYGMNPPAYRAFLSEDPASGVFRSADALFQSGEMDAVLIATPHYFHPPMCRAALEAGLHVLCEKPAGVYTKNVHELNEFAKTQNKTFAIMFNQRMNPLYQKMREIVKGGEWGELKRVNWIITNWFRTQYYYNSGGWRATWSGEGGGVLLNQCPHQLDLWQWICGMPSKIRAVCREGKWHDIEVEDDVMIYAEYPNGASGVFITTTGDCPGTNRLEITLEKAKLVCEDCGGFFGSKVWHSTDKYRRTIWQCNSKFSGEKRCGTPTLDTETIRRMFITAYNQLMQNRKEIISDCESMRKLLTDFTSLDAEIDRHMEETRVVAELVKAAVKENASTAQSQDAYLKKYESLTARYETASKELERLQAERTRRSQQDKAMRLFIRTLKRQPERMDTWDDTIWMVMVEKAIVHKDGGITFVFYNGTEIKVGA